MAKHYQNNKENGSNESQGLVHYTQPSEASATKREEMTGQMHSCSCFAHMGCSNVVFVPQHQTLGFTTHFFFFLLAWLAQLCYLALIFTFLLYLHKFSIDSIFFPHLLWTPGLLIGSQTMYSSADKTTPRNDPVWVTSWSLDWHIKFHWVMFLEPVLFTTRKTC